MHHSIRPVGRSKAARPLHPLDVRRQLPPELARAWRLVCLHRVGSTNDVAHRAGALGLLERLAVFAEVQTAGRGRLGRRWEVPTGLGLMGSTLWRPPVPPGRISTLAQVAGVATVRALADLGVSAALKWPNDVLVDGAKCGGILIESAVEDGALAYVVIGIGLNVLQSLGDLPPTPYPATSVLAATGRALERSHLAAALLRSLSGTYDRWLVDAAQVFHDWRAGLSTLGRAVTLSSPLPLGEGQSGGAALPIAGIARDVDPDGALVLERPDGSLMRYLSGEVSLRG